MSSKYITAIDIGSSKVAAIVGEKTSIGIKVLAYSEVPSEGVVRGEVIKTQKVANCIAAALQDVREKLDSIPELENYRIRKVYVNISGQNIKCISGSLHRERKDQYASIDRDEINSMLEEMYKYKVEPSEEVLYVAPQCYNVDEHMGETDPEDMDGKEIDGEYKIFIGKASAAAHCKSALDRLNIDISKLILTPIASGALLTDDEKELGCVLIDIGAGTTDVIIYQANILRYAAVIPFGGNSITEDISQTCGISMKNAEILKIKKGTCINEFAKEVTLSITENGMAVKNLPSKLLSSAIEARVCEILATVRHIIEISGFRNKLRSRAVLTGGSSQLDLIQLLAKNILKMDVRIGFPSSGLITNNSDQSVFTPQASTAAGLLHEGFRIQEKEPDNDIETEEPTEPGRDTREESTLFTNEEMGSVVEDNKREQKKEQKKDPPKPKRRHFQDFINNIFPTNDNDDEV